MNHIDELARILSKLCICSSSSDEGGSFNSVEVFGCSRHYRSALTRAVNAISKSHDDWLDCQKKKMFIALRAVQSRAGLSNQEMLIHAFLLYRTMT
jgi:hypothetical protein